MMNLPQCNGERKTFQLWWTRYQSYAAMQGWAFTLKEPFKKKLPDAGEGAWDTLPAQAAMQEKAVEMNLKAMWSLTMTFSTKQNMALVYAMQMEDWPANGVTWKVVKELKAEYQPNDRILLVEI